MKKKIIGVFVIISIILPITAYAQNNALIGRWEFWDGDLVYFFWESENIEFKTDGTVHNYDDEESGRYTLIDGERLRVRSDDDGYRYDFQYEINENNMLTIIDSDKDIAIFRRIR